MHFSISCWQELHPVWARQAGTPSACDLFGGNLGHNHTRCFCDGSFSCQAWNSRVLPGVSHMQTGSSSSERSYYINNFKKFRSSISSAVPGGHTCRQPCSTAAAAASSPTGMAMASSAAVSGWTAVLKELQQWQAQLPTAEQEAKVMRRVNKLLDQLGSLPAPAFKALVQEVQVTQQLAVQCATAFQPSVNALVKTAVVAVFAAWMGHTFEAHWAASPQSPVAASMRQQLQESGLQQHMPAMLTAAADDLAAAAAALAAAAEAGAKSSTSSGGSSSSSSSAEAVLLDVKARMRDASNLLDIRSAACELLSTAVPPSMEVVLPTAPAAVRLALCIYQTCSSLQQLRGPAPAGSSISEVQQLLQADSEYEGVVGNVLNNALIAMFNLVVSLSYDGWRAALGAPGSPDLPVLQPALAFPGARELLLCTQLVPALAISVLVALLAQDAGDSLSSGPGSTGASAAAATAGAGGSSSSSAGGGPPAQGSSRQQRRQQKRQQQRTGSSAAAPQQQPGSASRGRWLGSAVSLDSLTPLSSGLLGLLGVDSEVLLQSARGTELGRHMSLPDVRSFIDTYNDVLDCQVHTALDNGPYTTQLLQTLETDMLLSLAVRQLTASMPDSYPDAEPVREFACRLSCLQLLRLVTDTTRHRLPLSAPYTGPQLALQVLPSPLGPPAAAPDQQQQQADQPQWYVVTPTAQLLNELLPLVSSYCLSRLQQLQERRQQQMGAVYSQLQQIGDGCSEQAAARGSASAPAAAGSRLLGALEAASCGACPSCRKGLRKSMQLLVTLLQGALVPALDLTPAQLETEASLPVVTGGRSEAVQFPYLCVPHAPDALLQHAGGAMRACEALLRDAAVLCEAAAQLDDGRVAAAVADKAAAAQRTAAGVEAAEDNLAWAASLGAVMCHHQLLPTSDASCYGPSALGLAAAAAGPGSELQRQLFSLLCSMVKLGDAPVANIPAEAVQASREARRSVHAAAGDTAHALLVHAEQQAVGPAEGSLSDRAAVAALPSVFVLGRCCVLWAARLQSAPEKDAEGFEFLHTERVLTSVQHWLQAGSNQEQLVAAGYAPQALPQQLQQAVAALQAAKCNAGYAPQFAECCEEAAQQLRAVGAAICSFAVPSFCNNPTCRNMCGLTDVGLVSGRSCLCSGCLVARYCSRACQRAAWKQHKPVCAALAAAAAAAGAAAVPPPAGA